MNHLFVVLLATLLSTTTLFAESVAPALNGITLPPDYKDWSVISMLYRTDTNTLRVVVGNDTAMNAVRSGKTRPWPNGSILAKLSWRTKTRANFENALIPNKFEEVGLMIKNTEQFPSTGGWGFAQWLGKKPIPYGDDANFALECFGCHMVVKDNDYVFVEPAPLPNDPHAQ